MQYLQTNYTSSKACSLILSKEYMQMSCTLNKKEHVPTIIQEVLSTWRTQEHEQANQKNT